MPREAAIYDDGEGCVFLNCPYDPDYLPLFNAAVFTIVCCGLIPICALPKDDPAILRPDRIIDLISDLKSSKSPDHKETPEKIISTTMSIIVIEYDMPVSFTPSDVFRSLAAYERRLQQEKEAWLGGTIPWENTVKLAVEIAITEGLVPVG